MQQPPYPALALLPSQAQQSYSNQYLASKLADTLVFPLAPHLRKVVVISSKHNRLCMSGCQPAWRSFTNGAGQFSLTAGRVPPLTCRKSISLVGALHRCVERVKFWQYCFALLVSMQQHDCV